MVRWGIALSLVLVVGCVKSEVVPCGDIVCPVGFVCDPGHGGCSLAAQVDACDGKADLADCSYGTVADGVCSSGVCLPAGCGNGITEAGEACDDDNNLAGDDCSADCSSTEACGNGIIDPVNGESCDDGNTVSEDGCQENCVTPSCGDGHHDMGEGCDEGAMNSQAADAACRKNCTVRRCGDGVQDSNEACDLGDQISGDGCSFDCQSLEVCGNGYVDFVNFEVCDDNSLSHDACGACQAEPLTPWSTLVATPSPAARSAAGMAYDTARGQIVLFGGRVNSSANDETWVWNGRQWSLQPRVSVPPPRIGPAMAYDAARRVVVMFGGFDGPNYANDTWEWDGRKWTLMTPPGALPAGRWNHSMAYDAARKKVVLFGGSIGQQVTDVVNDTWEWNGTAWTDVTPASATDRPPARQGHQLAYDPVRNKTYVFGGRVGFGYKDDIWEWNGTVWDDVTPATGNITPRSDFGMAFDAVAGRVVIFGGWNAGYLNDTQEWTGTAWQAATDASPPGGRDNLMMAFDMERGRLVIHGGFNGGAETWERVGSDWSQSAVATSPNPPSARQLSTMTYDARRGSLWLFGGDGGTPLGDIYEWDRNLRAWHDRTPAQGQDAPSPRWAAAAAYDPVRNRLVVFGGFDTDADDETWEWDGSSWSQITPSGDIPPARYFHAMAYDVARQRVVLVGGRAGVNINLPGTIFNDVWEWNGTTWEAMGTIATARYGHGLVYDADRARLVLHGGRVQHNGTLLGDVWEREGTTWSDKTPTSEMPRARFLHHLAYDNHRGRVMLFGGNTGTLASDVWEWNGTTWKLVATENAESTYAGTFAFDSRHGELVQFGGYASNYRNSTRTLRFDRYLAEDGCRGYDGDFDGVAGCSDHDCYAGCTGRCNPALETCAAIGTRCGDSVCAGLENPRLCPADCGTAPVRCGDYLCESTESMASCAGDCTP